MKLPVAVFVFIYFVLATCQHLVVVDEEQPTGIDIEFQGLYQTKFETGLPTEETELIQQFPRAEKRFRYYSVHAPPNRKEMDERPCYKTEKGVLRRCTKEENMNRKDMIDYLLENEYFFAKARAESPELIWVRVTLMQTEKHDFNLEAFKNLLPGQKVNRFPFSTQQINQKDVFAQNVARMRRQFGEKHFSFHPETFFLPQDWSSIQQISEENPSQKWIAKPILGGQGHGIKIISADQIEKIPTDGSYLVQKYISNPFLMNGFKHTLRIYVFITSFNPLRVYINENGIAKFATTPYSTQIENFNNDNFHMHITNQIVNQYRPNFHVSESPTEITSGSRWSIQGWRNVVREKGFNDTKVWEDVKDCVLASMLSVESTIRAALPEYCPHRGQCFQILGTDLDVDDNMKPWLIESNVNPTLTSKVPFERLEKTKMIHDMFNMVHISNYNAKTVEKQVADKVHAFLAENVPRLPDDHILKNLSQEEIQDIIDLEYENLVKGTWQRIYPETPRIIAFGSEFEQPRSRLNEIASEWMKFTS